MAEALPLWGTDDHGVRHSWRFLYDHGGEPMTRKRDTWALIEAALTGADRILLYGPPGTGKTTTGMKAGDPSKVFKITLTEETPATDLLGHFVPKGDHFEWMDGRAISAWRLGARLVLDEIDLGSSDVLTLLYAILADPDVARLTLPNGSDVVPQDGFKVVATMNGHPEDLPAALRDRFEVAIRVDAPHPMAIKSLSPDLQEAAKRSLGHDDPDRALSIRMWKSFDKLRRSMGDEMAAQAVFGLRAEEITDAIELAGVST